MAVKFDTIIQNMIAKPCTKEGIPLFTRVDGKMDGGTLGVQVAPEGSEYAKRSRETCTSPDNLKRLFITCRGVYVHLHRPVLGSGKGLSLKREYMYSGDISKLIEVKSFLHERGMKFGGQMSQVSGPIQLPRGEVIDVKPGALEMDGFGLRALTRPHVYQNIEEIYFDWLVLSNMTSDRGRDFSYYLQSAQGDFNKAIKMLFAESCGVGISDVLKRYPRLHTIGYIDTLDLVYREFDKNIRSDYFGPWIGKVEQLPRAEMHIVQLRKDKDWIGQWSVKDGTYVFDRDVLAPFAEEVKRKYIQASERERLAAIEASKCEKERALDSLKSDTFTRATVKSMLISNELTVKEIEDTFSDEGKRKYLGIINSFRG